MIDLIEKENMYLYEDEKIILGFTKRTGGYSKEPFKSNNFSFSVGDDLKTVLKNRKKLAKQLNCTLEDFVFLNQKHTNNVYITTAKDKGKGAFNLNDSINEFDAQITKDKNIVITTFHADCVPILLTNEKRNFVSVVHAGWEGTSKEVLTNTIQKINELGITSEEIIAIIGPASCKTNYIVKQDVIDQINLIKDLKITKCYTKINEEDFLLDVKKVNYLQLVKANVLENNITIMKEGTTTDLNKFFSFRKEKQTGRMIAFAMLK